MSRPFLVTRFYCATCGGALSLEYKDAANNSLKSIREPGVERMSEPTGADMVHQVIHIRPCYNCLEPLRKLEATIKLVKELTNPEQQRK